MTSLSTWTRPLGVSSRPSPTLTPAPAKNGTLSSLASNQSIPRVISSDSSTVRFCYLHLVVHYSHINIDCVECSRRGMDNLARRKLSAQTSNLRTPLPRRNGAILHFEFFPSWSAGHRTILQPHPSRLRRLPIHHGELPRQRPLTEQRSRSLRMVRMRKRHPPQSRRPFPLSFRRPHHRRRRS